MIYDRLVLFVRIYTDLQKKRESHKTSIQNTNETTFIDQRHRSNENNTSLHEFKYPYFDQVFPLFTRML